jgi:hypothetical protein
MRAVMAWNSVIKPPLSKIGQGILVEVGGGSVGIVVGALV